MTTSATPDTSATSPAPASKKATPRKASPRKAVTRKTRAASTKKTAPRKAAAPAQPAKTKKPKLVRDGYTLPKDEYAALGELKQRCAKLAHAAKKSELLRAGIKVLASLSDKALLAALKAVPSIKTGRPKKA